MGKADSIQNIRGKVGSLIFYRLRGSGDMVVRSNGYKTRSALNHHPRYEKTRQENMEFKGCVRASKDIIEAVSPIKLLGDFNSFGQLVRVCKFIQQADTSLPKGSRSVSISRSHSLLNGFSFSRYNTFESLVRAPLSIYIDRKEGNSRAIIPPMRPGIHLQNPAQQPQYRFVYSIGTVCDLSMSEKTRNYETMNHEDATCYMQCSEWMSWKETFPGTELFVQVPGWVDSPHRTLIAGIGIEFGRPSPSGEIEFVKKAGAGKIWVTA